MSRENSDIPVTVLLAVFNEEANIARCLGACKRARRVVVLDSGSTDATCEIARTAGVEVVQFQYQGGYPKKRQWALSSLSIETEWILFLDADEVAPPKLWEEIGNVINHRREEKGFLIKKGFHFLGRRMRFGGFSHHAVLLVRRDYARFEQLVEVPGDTLDMEVHERVIVDGSIGALKTPLIHEDFKGLAAYIDKHNRYSTWESQLRYRLFSTQRYGKDSIRPNVFGNAQERRRWFKRIAVYLPGEAFLWFIYHYVLRLGFLEGRAGFIASQIRKHYISDVRSKMYELQLIAKRDGTGKK